MLRLQATAIQFTCGATPIRAMNINERLPGKALAVELPSRGAEKPRAYSYDLESHNLKADHKNRLRSHSLQATQAGPLRNDAQIAKSGELPPKALVRVDAIRKAGLTNLDCALDCLFAEVEHPVHERPVCNLVVGRGMQAIAGNH